MNEETCNPLSAQACIEELAKLSDGMDEHDLPGLAKMHEVCSELVDAVDAAASFDGRDAARDLLKALEALILGQVDDAGVAIRAVLESVSSLAGLTAPSSSAPEEDVDRDTRIDESVAARLDRIFEDDEPKQEQPTTPDAAEAPEPEIDPASELPPPEPPYVSEPLLIDNDEIEIVAGFVEEATEHIDAVEAAVLEVERAPEDVEAIDTLFRPFHTIKGAAGFLNLRDIVSLTHEAETLLDQARKGNRTINPGLIDLVFEVVDVLKVQIGGIRTYLANPNGEPVPQPSIESMVAHLRDVVAGRAEASENAPAEGSPDAKVGENLIAQGAVAPEAVDFAVAEAARRPGDQKTGEALIKMGVVTPKQVSQALRPQAQRSPEAASSNAAPQADQSVRIDTAKLDALVDMVGELVIAQTQVSANPRIHEDQKLAKNVSQVEKIVRDVQDVAMAMRMIPIGPTFQKMSRLVRDVSRKVGKSVELTISGEETEVDKNVIQLIADPLVHMVRNAVDHGIENTDGRVEAGKSPTGRIHLSAFHQGGNIVIEIADDGKGLHAESLIKQGIEKGIVQPDETLTDEQAYQLIFAPGFSLAQEVTGISGRGVGMDVVRRNIEHLRGKVSITSTFGKGTTFAIRLPLTLAIIDGMVVRVGSERFILQTVTVEQALRPKPEQIKTVQQKTAVLNVRGRLIPLVQLGQLFGLTGPVDPSSAMVVVAQYGANAIGLVVDELIGQQQVVIKSLGERFKGLSGISGAAILGDGRVGLILEVAGIAAVHNASETELCKAPSESDQVLRNPEAASTGVNGSDVGIVDLVSV